MLKMKIEKMLLIAATSLLALTGCKDRTPEQYRQEKVSAELSRYQAISGTYRGMAVNTATGQNIGLIAITIRSYMRPGSSSDGSSGAGTAVLDGLVTLFNGSQSNAVIQSAIFVSEDNAASGNFSGRITVPMRNGITADVAINGAIGGGAFNGIISPSGRGPNVSFTTVRDAPFPRDGQNQTWPGQENGIFVYEGSFKNKFCDTVDGKRNSLCQGQGGQLPDVRVKMTVNLNPPQSGELFMNNISYVKTVSVQIAFNESQTLPIPSAELDQDAGTIEFNGMVKDAQISLSCRRHPQDAGYRCVLSNTSGLRVVYEFDVLPRPAAPVGR